LRKFLTRVGDDRRQTDCCAKGLPYGLGRYNSLSVISILKQCLIAQREHPNSMTVCGRLHACLCVNCGCGHFKLDSIPSIQISKWRRC